MHDIVAIKWIVHSMCVQVDGVIHGHYAHATTLAILRWMDKMDIGQTLVRVRNQACESPPSMLKAW